MCVHFLILTLCFRAAHTTVEFVLPETYPDVAPEMSIVAHSNLSCEQVEDLEALLQEQVCIRGLHLGAPRFTVIAIVTHTYGSPLHYT